MLARVADSLYWMSRYVERAEHTARLLNVHLMLVPDQLPSSSLHRRTRLLESLSMTPPLSGVQNDYHLVDLVVFDQNNSQSLLTSIATARENARQVREQISSEMWQQLNKLYLFVQNSRLDSIWHDSPSAFLTTVKQEAHLFQGITDSTLSHGQGWHFIQVARYLERTIELVRLIDTETKNLALDQDPNAASEQYANWLGLLKGATAFEAYCKVHTAHLEPKRVVEFLLLDREFPHSVSFSVRGILRGLQAISSITETNRAERVHRLAGRLNALLDYAHVDEIIDNGLHNFLPEITQGCFDIHDALYEMYIAYPLEDKLVA